MRDHGTTLPDRVILGIDPGTNVLGYGVLHLRGKRVEMEVMGVIDLRIENNRERHRVPYLRKQF